MAYNYEKYLEKVRKFGEESWVKDYLEAQKKPNFWSILEYREYKKSGGKKTAYEIRISRMIRWLLDPTENHNLGNAFTYKLIQLINEKNRKTNKGIVYRAKDKLDQDEYEKVKVVNEEKYIDVLYKDLSQKVFMAIEVKQYSEEGFDKDGISQLDYYQDKVKEEIREKDPQIQECYIYLTPLGEESSNENWTPVSYKEFIKIIEEVFQLQILNSKDKYNEDIKKIVLDFKEDLQRIVNILRKDDEYIEKEFNKNKSNKKLTMALEKELIHGSNTDHMKELKRLDKGKTPNLKELILLIREYISIQRKKPNLDVMRLTRMIYNYISDGDDLDYNLNIKYDKDEKVSSIKSDLIKDYGLDLDTISLTQGKGQGLNLYHKDGKHRIYMSGDTYGSFPNDGIQIALVDGNKGIYKSKKIKNREFNVDNDFTLEGRIKHGDKEINLQQLMEDHVMEVIEELSDKITNEY